jgi:hypothetical protein
MDAIPGLRDGFIFLRCAGKYWPDIKKAGKKIAGQGPACIRFRDAFRLS